MVWDFLPKDPCVSSARNVYQDLTEELKNLSKQYPRNKKCFTGSIQFGRLVYWFCLYLLCQGRDSTISHVICRHLDSETLVPRKLKAANKSQRHPQHFTVRIVDQCSHMVRTTFILVSTPVPKTL